MKMNISLSVLAKFCLPSIVLLSTLSTQAQISPEGHYKTEDGRIVFNLEACRDIPCELNYQYAKVRIVGGYLDQFEQLHHASHAPLRIISNLPIVDISTQSQETTTIIRKRTLVFPGCKSNQNRWFQLADHSKYISQIDFTHNSNCSSAYRVSHIAVSVGSSLSILEDMQNAAISLITSYRGTLEHLNQFRQIVARDSSDARHLGRLEAQLKAVLKTMADEQGNPILPVTHRRVTEASRMIMVLSTVLEEITDKYDFESPILAPLNPSKIALSQLSKQIRSAFGWEQGLAGSGSKALASLSAILDIELRNIYSIVATAGDASTAKVFNSIFRANSNLYNRVMASNAGDAAGAALAAEVIRQWNSAEFQKILSLLMSAPKESQASLQNRILVALTAVESIKDYVDPRGEIRMGVDVPPDVRAKLD